MQRLMDILLSGFAIIIFSPLLIAIIIILKFTGEGEVFYKQIRIGRNLREFSVLKFATMLRNSPNIGPGTITLKNDPRILPVGKFLRKTKLNEIPQLINVLIGDMSLIGPRPQTSRCFYAFDTQTQQMIATVRPGLSGIGSIVFRDEELMLGNVDNSLQFYDGTIAPYKGSLERWYVQNKNFKVYLLLIFFTVECVITSRSHLLWRLFPDLPTPPKELSRYLS